MSNMLIALFLGAGAGAFAYAKLGKRVGYGNSGNVLSLVAISSILVFVMVLILLNTVVSLD